MNALFRGFVFVFMFLSSYFGQLSCRNDIPKCKRLINLELDYKCIYSNQDLFRSQIHVCGNSSFNECSSGSTIQSREKLKRQDYRFDFVYLNAYPVLLEHNLRYKAHFCIEVQSDILSQTTICELTVELELEFFVGEESLASAKFYFRLPDWERLNGQSDVHQCAFAPFVYVAEKYDANVDEIIITASNCSQSVVQIEQRKEVSEELIQKKSFIIKDFKINRISYNVTNAPLHFYKTVVKDNEANAASMEGVLIPVLTILTLALVPILWCIKLHFLPPKNAILFLLRKPRVRFQYFEDSAFEMYRRQTEILMMFMENFCNIVVVNDCGKSNEETQRSDFLPRETFDVIVPFPVTDGRYYLEEYCKRQPLKSMTKDIIILELPFWSISSVPFEELHGGNEKFKYFKLMDEFIPFVRHLNRRRSMFEKRFLCSLSTQEMLQKLEENNLTNDGFRFCLEQTCSSDSFLDGKRSVEAGWNGFVHLQEVEM